MLSALLTGRSITFVERSKGGTIKGLWLLDPKLVTVTREKGVLRYRYRDGAAQPEKTYKAQEVVDIVWMPAFNGIDHHDPVARLRNAIGLSIAMEEYGAKFFQNGGVPPLQLVGPLGSPGAVARAATDITGALQEARKDGRPILPMPFNHELKQIGFDPQKGQLTEERRFQVEEIARVFQLPPVFLQDLTHGTFSNTEQQDLHFVKHTLMQWLKAWEQELNLKLIGFGERKRFIEFNVDGLLRGDFSTRMTGYATAVQNAINTPDEVRDLENWPRKGGDADKLHIQGATVPLGQQPKQSSPSAAAT
jgi:HK97 family phage portal protein